MPFRFLIVALVLLATFVGAPLSATAEDDALDHITRAATIRIAVPNNFPPFGDVGTDGTLEGYDIDTARYLASALGVQADLIGVSSTDRVPSLISGKVDLVIYSLGKDSEREQMIDFSIAYAPFFSGLYGPDRIAVTKPDDLGAKTIAVTRNTIEDAALTQLGPPTATIKRYDDNAATEVAYLSGQAELIATGNVVAAQILPKSPLKRTALKFVLRNSPCYIGVRKNEPRLLGRINQIIAAARNDGTLNNISIRWLKVPVGDPELPDPTIK